MQLDLNLVIPTFGKERANGPIDEARGENFFLGWAAFALEVTAGEFAGGGSFLTVVDGERKEILAFFSFDCADGCDEDNRFA